MEARILIFTICSLFFIPLTSAETYRGLTIAPEINTPIYDRNGYGDWIDENDDGADTRQEVLDQESWYLVDWIEIGSKWKVEEGLWFCPYTGRTTYDPSDVDIDHMVPLKEVHQSGGHAWNAQRKQDYANDLDNPNTLIAVDDSSNISKLDRDPANWLPPNRSYWCEYLTAWIDVKKKWDLTVDQAEVDALKEGFKVCDKYKNGDKLEGRH